jgi:hypothetical protein
VYHLLCSLLFGLHPSGEEQYLYNIAYQEGVILFLPPQCLFSGFAFLVDFETNGGDNMLILPEYCVNTSLEHSFLEENGASLRLHRKKVCVEELLLIQYVALAEQDRESALRQMWRPRNVNSVDQLGATLLPCGCRSNEIDQTNSS